jgi:uncharacterized membrane protein YfhO
MLQNKSLRARANDFHEKLAALKNANPFEDRRWYPWPSLGSMDTLDEFLAGPAPVLQQCSGDRVQVIERRTSSLALQANMACRGMVILSATFFPGWEATVDSRRVPIYEIDGARGVVAGAGVHRIEMRYRPASVLAGGIMTLAGSRSSLWLRA